MGSGERLRTTLLVSFLLSSCKQLWGLDAPSRARVDASPDAVLIDAATDSSGADVRTEPLSFQEMIFELGLSSGLLVVLDAGDLSSYPGGVTWLNTVTGGPNFDRGADAAAGTDDPTFVGTVGARTSSEYFNFDGDDWFQASATGWGDQGFYTSSGAVTIAAMVFSPSAAVFRIFSNCRCSTGGITTTGAAYSRLASGFTAWYQEGDTNTGYSTTGTIQYPVNEWAFSAVSVSAVGGTSDIIEATNRAFETYADETENYGTNAPDRRAAIGADGEASGGLAADNSRIALVAIWSRALSQAELGLLYDKIKLERYTTLP